MNRKLSLVASALFLIAFFAMATVASAQVDSCCLRINNPTDCHISVCAQTVTGALRCETVLAHANGGFRFLCSDSVHFAVVDDACGIDHRLILNQCVPVVLRGGCCACARLTLSPDGCYQVDVELLPGPCPCP
jgi:hypothetical protein